MLGLTLREEFRGKRLKGTAIELSNESNIGATQVAAKEFLAITCPTDDLLKGVEALGPNQGQPIVVIGEPSLGKSLLLAVLYHTLDFGRILWGEAREYPQEILLPAASKTAGLFHLRIT